MPGHGPARAWPGSRRSPMPAAFRRMGSRSSGRSPSRRPRGPDPRPLPLANSLPPDLIAGMNSRQETPSEWQGEARRIKLHGPEAFEAMRKAGRLAAETLDFITPMVTPGTTTETLDKLCHDFIVERRAIPAPLNYRGFPKSICTSINHVVCHGIPSEKRLQNGDIVNIDVTPILDGWYGDSSRMYFAGDVGVKARKLCDVTYEGMMRGIATARPGSHVGDIGHAI